jgi:hypothetical protein
MINNLANNKVFVNDLGLVEIQVIGDQTVSTVDAMGTEAARLGEEIKKTGKKVLVLDNLLQIGKVPTDARRHVVELAKTMPYDKLAMVGKGTVIRLGTNLMLQATGRGDRVKYFDDYAKAVQWLAR